VGIGAEVKGPPLTFILAALASFECLGQPGAGVRVELTIRDLPVDLKKQEQEVRENVQVGIEMWTKLVVAKPVSIEVELKFQPWPARGAGRSLTGVPLGGEKVNGRTLLEEGMPYELRTGIDPNGSSPDVEIILDPEYAKTIWWDPNPRTRRRPMPANMLDAVSVISHEIGHAMGFNGRIDPKSGQFTGNELSTYDRWVEFDGKDFFFNGPAAMKVFRKKIPLSKTQTNYHHFGEPGPRLDRRLKDALMNGLFFEYGKRYVVSDLDIAVLADCGLELRK
jgi:hypothetical protein